MSSPAIEDAPELGQAASSPGASPRRAALAAAACLVGFLALLLLVRTTSVPWDVSLHRYAVGHRPPAVRTLARLVTTAGTFLPVLCVVLAAGLLFSTGTVMRRVGTAALLGAAVVLGVMTRTGLVHLVGRERPPRGDWAGAAGGFAFPSGHTSSATLAAGALAWAATRHLARPGHRAAVWAAAGVYAAAVGWSRVWLGVHWPTDVLGAWLFAAGWLATMRLLALAVLRRRQVND